MLQLDQVPWDDPINSATGRFFESLSDATMSAPGIGFTAARTYNSSNTAVGLLGKGWTFSYAASLAITSSQATYTAEDGQQIVYTKNSDGTFKTPTGVTSKLAAVAGGYALTTKTHETLSFDSSGQLTAWKDSSNQGVTLSYTSGVLSKVTDAAGREVQIGVTGGKLAKVTLPDGRYVSYAYTGDLLTQVRDLAGHNTAYEYDGSGRLAKVKQVEKNRYVVQNTYNSGGQVTQQVGPTGGVSSYKYNYPYKGDVTRVDPRGNEWTNTYIGNVLMASSDPIGNMTQYSYNQNKQRVSALDPNWNTTTMGYDAAGNMNSRQVEGSYASAEKWVYDAADNLKSYTNKNNVTTTYEYDSANRLIKTVDPENGTAKPTLYTYTSKGQLETETSPEGHVTTYGYDSQGNRTSSKTPLGKVTTFTYDTTGRMSSETDPRGADTSDPDDYTTHYGYDDADHVLQVTDARNHVTKFAYDEAGDKVQQTDPYDKTTMFTYDAAHRVTSMAKPGLSPATWSYDKNGNLLSQTDPTGAVTTYDYDQVNRKIHMITARGNVSGATPADYTWKFYYDANSNLAKVVDPTDTAGVGTKTYYDALDRPSEVVDQLSKSTTTTYDGEGNVTKVTDPLNHSTQTSYDGLSRGKTTTDARGKVTRYGYDGDSNLVSVTTPLGFKTSYGYDADGNQTLMVDPRGNASGADPAQYTWKYGYDPAGEQTTVEDPLGNKTVTDYDPTGNVAKVTSPQLRRRLHLRRQGPVEEGRGPGRPGRRWYHLRL